MLATLLEFMYMAASLLEENWPLNLNYEVLGLDARAGGAGHGMLLAYAKHHVVTFSRDRIRLLVIGEEVTAAVMELWHKHEHYDSKDNFPVQYYNE
ncbi:hypothetical protein VNO77_23452 [Canavalia gladiata]|uniref:Uncharacterized protein n=1 Tax=Canavalia gladiata TaxID=3824 RepID=A0AAN9QBQ1_CANGL